MAQRVRPVETDRFRCMMEHMKRLTGIAFLAFPLLLQVPYGLLTARFDYPGILRESPSAILTKYAAAGPELTLIWYLFGILILPLLFAQSMLPEVADAKYPRLLRAATKVGIVSAMLQTLGLLRWVFAVPLLASAYVAHGTTEDTRRALETIFQVQHQLLGVMMGEHLGQLLLAIWTTGVVTSLPGGTRLMNTQRGLGLAAALLFLVGTGEGLSGAFPALEVLGPVSAVAFMMWSLWCALLGWTILRQTAPERLRSEARPFAKAAVEDAGL